MPKLYLIRHARPAGRWGEDPNPGLDATRQQQAETAASMLSQMLDRMPIYGIRTALRAYRRPHPGTPTLDLAAGPIDGILPLYLRAEAVR